jgi:hypothetical protein
MAGQRRERQAAGVLVDHTDTGRPGHADPNVELFTDLETAVAIAGALEHDDLLRRELWKARRH